jgi:tryptophan synthase alpha chain
MEGRSIGDERDKSAPTTGWLLFSGYITLFDQIHDLNLLGDTMQQTSAPTIPVERITKAFEQARNENRGVLIPYFMCGYPATRQSIELVLTAAQAGADIIELGMPFSDPLADGATIQHAGHIALERGITIRGCFEIAFEISCKSDVPLVLMGYYNPILSYGLDAFCKTAVTSGVCGLIVPDLPPEECGPLQSAAQKHGLSLIFLIPPSTTDERIIHIAKLANRGHGSFLYCVALNGVTGARATLPIDLQTFIQRVYGYTKEYHLPIAVGFGISTPEHVRELMAYAEGVVVGSAVVKQIDEHIFDEAKQIEAISVYISSLHKACIMKKED